MLSFIIKYIVKRVLNDNQLNRIGVEDPYFEYIPIGPVAPNPSASSPATKQKLKKVARRIPDGLTENDTGILNKFKRDASRYDMWFSVFGIKFGWTNIVGIIPLVGPVVSAYWSLSLLWLARGITDGFPLDLQLLFLFNIIIDFALGLIPIVGDLIGIGYKSNLRNYLLLEKHLFRVGQKNQGKISEQEVRPSFINDRVQPVIEEQLAPGAAKVGAYASEQIMSLISNVQGSATTKSSQASLKSSVSTTHTDETTVMSSQDEQSIKASII